MLFPLSLARRPQNPTAPTIATRLSTLGTAPGASGLPAPDSAASADLDTVRIQTDARQRSSRNPDAATSLEDCAPWDVTELRKQTDRSRSSSSTSSTTTGPSGQSARARASVVVSGHAQWTGGVKTRCYWRRRSVPSRHRDARRSGRPIQRWPTTGMTLYLTVFIIDPIYRVYIVGSSVVIKNRYGFIRFVARKHGLGCQIIVVCSAEDVV